MDLKNDSFVGLVVDNKDPLHKGRCKIRVFAIHGFNDPNAIPDESLDWATPWKDLNGNQFILPGIGKVVTVVFDNGNPKYPEYISAENYNINLINKLNGYTLRSYSSMKGVMVDDKTQIYSNIEEGLIIDYKFSRIKFGNDGKIIFQLKDQTKRIRLGTDVADQQVILGNNFLDWFDSFLTVLNEKPFIGNLGIESATAPNLKKSIDTFKSNFKNFLSDHIKLVSNNTISTFERKADPSNSDNYSGKNIPPPETPPEPEVIKLDLQLPEDLIPQEQTQFFSDVILNLPEVRSCRDVSSTGTSVPPELRVYTGNIPNGELHLSATSVLFKSAALTSSIGDDPNLKPNYLIKEAQESLDAMWRFHESSEVQYTGKIRMEFSRGYRDLATQQRLRREKGNGAAVPGTSNHGWGKAFDLGLGLGEVSEALSTVQKRGFGHPLYAWMFRFAPQFGWYNPQDLRDGTGTDEYWHWEWIGRDAAIAHHAKYPLKPVYALANIEPVTPATLTSIPPGVR